MDFDEDTKQISKYNDAFLSISRLNESWLRCNRFMKTGNFQSWKFELDIIWLELFPDILRQSDKQMLFKKNDEQRVLLSKSKNKEQLFFRLMKRHEFMRMIQDKAGKGGVYVDENEEGFE